MNAVQFSATLDILSVALGFTAPVDGIVSRHFRDHPELGANDRNVIAETVFGVLRHLPQLEWITEGNASTREILLAWFVGVKRLNLRELPAAFHDKDKERAGQLKARPVKDAPLHVRAALPEWVVQMLLDTGRSEAFILELGYSLLSSAPLDVRVNTLKMKRDSVQREIERHGMACQPTPYSPWGLRLEGKPAVNRLTLFKEGVFEVQDEGSQLLALLTGAKRGQMVADFCAGAGGKTLALGAMMNSTGRLYAFDVSEKRLNNLKPRLARSGLSNVQAQLIASENDQKIKRLAGKFDAVLVDAPCSGMGTTRRNPDLKVRQSPQSVAELNAKQSSILASAARLVKSGGRLVYATCSFLPAENETIVRAFLAEHPDFELLNAQQLLADARVQIALEGDMLQLWPQLHQTDAFFAAVLQKKL
ncbi:RsmB/NOP family class I SAM-dependent RNA methyltransferase [Chitinilyticum piscinae]|uniref:RsmB/NOP family class I SAM-dependent RNA methyltransferase n=1 Tax=Chitinilyticum piscinae TaxID=2866724 RepID=A0A8J7K2V9_9NEIS|nr:RsmB/NOP family class I SAM-dependent RNA methyltransferase [Chitinilyticum piscinae]MBE9610552.1 RsmB/NOP family class I SAM-dependent RNA methyltransferase [Chitinilyticum piscinae]